MSNIINEFLLARDKFKSRRSMSQSQFTNRNWVSFKKKKKKKQEFKATGDSRYIYKNELDKTCFQHDMAYGDLKDLPRHSKLLVIQSTIDITMDSYPWSTNTLIKRLVTLVLVEEQESLRIKNWIIKDTEPSQGNLKNAKYIFLWRLGCCSYRHAITKQIQ